jgi:hypothetical protein
MEKIAAEYRKGRAFNIGTANLDSMRPVIWRIGVDQTCRDDLDFNLAYIPSDFTEQSEHEFDSEYMRKLFEMALARAAAGLGRRPEL